MRDVLARVAHLPGAVRRHPWIGALVFLFLVALGVGGTTLWWHHELVLAGEAIRQQHWDQARMHVGRCMTLWPWSPEAHLIAARLERLTGRLGEAEAHLHECQRLQHGANEAVQLEWLLVRAQGGELDQVAPGLLHLVRQGNAEAPAILEALSLAYLQAKRFARAEDCLDRWLEREPENSRALAWRGRARAVLGNVEGAEQDLGRCLDLDPERDEARLGLAELLLRQGNAPAARPHLERLARSRPEDPQVPLALARCRLLEGKLEQARSLLDDVLRSRPDNPQALTVRGQVELQAGRPAQAEPWLRRAIEAEPSNPEAFYHLYLSQKGQGHDKEAAQTLTEHDRLKRDMARVSFLLRVQLDRKAGDADTPAEVGRLYLRHGNVRQGLHWLLLAVQRDPRHRTANESLAEYYEQAGQAELANRYRQALQ